MQTRRLGRGGPMVAELGFGGRSLGPDWRGIEPRDVQRVLCEAIEAGVDVVDTSPAWGDAEALTGEAVRTLRARDRVVVATQVPFASATATLLEHQLPVAYVQTCVEQSLRATRLEVLPLVQLAGAREAWLSSSAWPEVRGTLERLGREGKLLRFGLIAADPPELGALLDDPLIATVQVGFDVFDRRAADVLAHAARREVGVIVRSPLAGGALGGELGATSRFPPLDARAERFDEARLAEIAVRVAKLATLVGCAPPAATSSDAARAITEAAASTRPGIDDVEIDRVAELALLFLLDRPEISVAVIGMRTSDHLRANLAVADGRRLSPRIAAALAAHAWEGG